MFLFFIFVAVCKGYRKTQLCPLRERKRRSTLFAIARISSVNDELKQRACEIRYKSFMQLFFLSFVLFFFFPSFEKNFMAATGFGLFDFLVLNSNIYQCNFAKLCKSCGMQVNYQYACTASAFQSMMEAILDVMALCHHAG